jgi:hypothetical protein
MVAFIAGFVREAKNFFRQLNLPRSDLKLRTHGFRLLRVRPDDAVYDCGTDI